MLAHGTVRSGPERVLVDDYLKRADGLARRVGLLGVVEIQVDAKSDETPALLGRVPDGATVIALDERGRNLTSRQISQHIARTRDGGARDLVLMIGPADGFRDLPATIPRWSLGAQTWPHKLLRAMAAEQIYRAVSILAGHPYHRD